MVQVILYAFTITRRFSTASTPSSRMCGCLACCSGVRGLACVQACPMLWSEIFSFGETPWPDLTDHEVIRAVRRQERMDAPPDCPEQVRDHTNTIITHMHASMLIACSFQVRFEVLCAGVRHDAAVLAAGA